ncbi:MAG: hypothetical protein HY690_07430 [Chloroflexi bacterium]|nr:hypothetical protein [Chloroflexota bacterium]
MAASRQRHPTEPHRPVGLRLVLEVEGAVFAAPGDYGFHLLVDTLEMAVVPLYIRQGRG